MRCSKNVLTRCTSEELVHISQGGEYGAGLGLGCNSVVTSTVCACATCVVSRAAANHVYLFTNERISSTLCSHCCSCALWQSGLYIKHPFLQSEHHGSSARAWPWPPCIRNCHNGSAEASTRRGTGIIASRGSVHMVKHLVHVQVNTCSGSTKAVHVS